jgi:hypothetical protein
MAIGILNGNIFVIFDQGLGVQSALHTLGLYLSDGTEHQVLVNFTDPNRLIIILSVSIVL